MYIIRFYFNKESCEVAIGDYNNLMVITNIFEAQQISYKVSNSCGYLDPKNLGLNGHEYWKSATYIFGQEKK